MASRDPDYNPAMEEEVPSPDQQTPSIKTPKTKRKKSEDGGPRTPSVRQPATYAAVHIENLVKPKTECLIRAIDRAHVENIKREMREKQVTKFTLIVANVSTPDMPPIKDLQKARSCRLEVLGGNHTRQAAMELWVETEDKRYALWPCQLYHQLTEEESKALAYLHNRNHEVAKQMTFLDYVRLFRTERVACQKAGASPETLEFEWKEKLCHMMSLTKRILSANYMAALRVSSVNDTVWPHLASLFTAWDKGHVKGQKKGPMKAYFLANAHFLDDRELITCIKDMLKGALSPRSFQKRCAEAGAKFRRHLKRQRSKDQYSDAESDNGVSIRSRSTSNEDSEEDSDSFNCDSQRQNKVKVMSKNSHHSKRRRTDKKEPDVLFGQQTESLTNQLTQQKDTNKELQARLTEQDDELVNLRADNAILEQKEANHQEEIAHLKTKIAKLEKKERDTSDELLKAKACLSLCRKAETELREKVKQMESSLPSRSHTRHKLKVNDIVEAQWEDGLWYPACVVQVLKHDAYRVKFLEDNIVCDVQTRSIKPLL
ncbi:uncharacterized protein LOC124291320 [Haliotis rubra]|uniref:uncharacterized protein LOC124291320 n=1 Tax=Haliotis rubra TaxID=36100 RepID=UPI001EE5641D|nr:uncharacterized protein LOC124291320 [Haliotis rubra]XP_046584249.1 uncharacterized protein LOC124291320 [Haliotis rubra]